MTIYQNIQRFLDQTAQTLRENSRSLLIFLSGFSLSYYLYWNVFGKNLQIQNQELDKQIKHGEKKLRDLQTKLLSLETTDLPGSSETHEPRKEIRVWMDGAFDMMHFGHMNAFRQGRSLGTYLIAGVNSDETITACKGPPVCNEKERIDTVRGCKWVDEVVEGVPYVMNDEYLSYIIEKYKIDYIVHGDDPCIVDGKNVYESAVRLGKYLTIPRTEGVSTTDIVGRMLLMSSAHHEVAEQSTTTSSSSSSANDGSEEASSSIQKLVRTIQEKEQLQGNNTFDRKSNFLTTSRIIRLFGAGVKAPRPTDKVVYIAGAWDMFHAGHIETLEKAKKLGNYVIVGIFNDQIVNQKKGLNYPIMSLHERVLSVLGCRFVDDVLIDAPYAVTQEMIQSLRIQIVARVTVAGQEPTEEIEDPFALPKSLGILQTITINHTVTAADFVDRIQAQQERYAKRYVKKMEAEKDFYKQKYSL